MKKVIFIIAFLVSCESDPINLDGDIISSIQLSKSELIADGSDNALIKVNFNKEVDVSKIKLKVNVNNGTFLDSSKQTIEMVPTIDLENNISAEFKLQSSTTNKDYLLEFLLDPYVVERTIASVKSEPSSIKLTADSFSVGNNFNGEIKLEGQILNEKGKKVSNGVHVQIFDFFEDGSDVNGVFRDSNLISANDSKISTIYSPGFVSANQKILLLARIVDENNNPSGITDSLYINVIDPN